MVPAARPACGRRGCLLKGISRVTSFKARDFQRCRVCHTRVEPVSETNVGSGTGRKASPPVQWLHGREYPWPDSLERGARGACPRKRRPSGRRPGNPILGLAGLR